MNCTCHVPFLWGCSEGLAVWWVVWSTGWTENAFQDMSCAQTKQLPEMVFHLRLKNERKERGLFLLISKNSPSEAYVSSPLNSCFADLEVSLPTEEVSLMAKQPQCHPTKTTARLLWTSHAPEPLGLGKETRTTTKANRWLTTLASVIDFNP